MTLVVIVMRDVHLALYSFRGLCKLWLTLVTPGKPLVRLYLNHYTPPPPNNQYWANAGPPSTTPAHH